MPEKCPDCGQDHSGPCGVGEPDYESELDCVSYPDCRKYGTPGEELGCEGCGHYLRDGTIDDAVARMTDIF